MKHNSKIERELLLLIEEKDTGGGVRFVDHELIKTTRFTGDINEVGHRYDDLNAQRRYSIRLMSEAGLVKISKDWEAELHVSLTLKGHAALQEHQNNTLTKRTLRVLGRLSERALSSIFLPIVVSILTVLSLKWLGLGSN